MGPIERKESLSTSIIKEFRRLALEEKLLEGDKLPNQNELALQLGVSRSSLREALLVLNSIGAIEQRPGVGTVLRSRAPLLMLESMDFQWSNDERSMKELLVARRTIDMMTVQEAASNGTPEEIEKLKKIVQEMTRPCDQISAHNFRHWDLMFHNTLATMSKNKYFMYMYSLIWCHLDLFFAYSFTLPAITIDNAINGHVRIFEEVSKHNLQGAAKEMDAHLTEVETAIQEFYK